MGDGVRAGGRGCGRGEQSRAEQGRAGDGVPRLALGHVCRVEKGGGVGEAKEEGSAGKSERIAFAGVARRGGKCPFQSPLPHWHFARIFFSWFILHPPATTPLHPGSDFSIRIPSFLLPL